MKFDRISILLIVSLVIGWNSVGFLIMGLEKIAFIAIFVCIFFILFSMGFMKSELEESMQKYYEVRLKPLRFVVGGKQ